MGAALSGKKQGVVQSDALSTQERVRAKVERAKEHVVDAEAAVRAFFQTNVYSAVTQFNEETRRVKFVVDQCPGLPLRVSAIVADAISNLRSVLDVAWRQAYTRGKANRRKDYFPLVLCSDELETRFSTVKKAHQKAAVDILRAIKSDEVWRQLQLLNETNIRDKHEMPILAVAALRRYVLWIPGEVTFAGRTGELRIEAERERHLFLEHGTKLGLELSIETNKGLIKDMQCQLSPDIAFGEGEVLEGQPVIETLNQLADLVEGIVGAFMKAKLLAG